MLRYSFPSSNSWEAGTQAPGPEGITGGEIDLLDNHVLLTDAGPRRTIETSLQAHSIAIREKYRCSSALRRVVYV